MRTLHKRLNRHFMYAYGLHNSITFFIIYDFVLVGDFLELVE